MCSIIRLACRLSGDKMICAYYESDDHTEGCFSPLESFISRPTLINDTNGKPMSKLFEIEGNDWEDCMTKYHEHMGWETYKP